LENGKTPSQAYEMDKKLVRSAFDQVSDKFKKLLKAQHAQGNLLDIPAGPVHHWNYNKGDFADQIFDPRNLYPTRNRDHHINEIHKQTTSGHITNDPIRTELVIPFDDSYFPLPF
jgi:hypothetical protein